MKDQGCGFSISMLHDIDQKEAQGLKKLTKHKKV
jgi:hypothetical protein